MWWSPSWPVWGCRLVHLDLLLPAPRRGRERRLAPTDPQAQALEEPSISKRDHPMSTDEGSSPHPSVTTHSTSLCPRSLPAVDSPSKPCLDFLSSHFLDFPSSHAAGLRRSLKVRNDHSGKDAAKETSSPPSHRRDRRLCRGIGGARRVLRRHTGGSRHGLRRDHAPGRQAEERSRRAAATLHEDARADSQPDDPACRFQ